MSNSNPNSIKVFAPATVANVACGFDVLAFAIHGPGDYVTVKKTDKPGVTISSITGEDGKLPREPMENTAGRALLAMMKTLDAEPGFGLDITIEKKMPLGSGLGSSAASAAGAVAAANILLNERWADEQLLEFALEGELAASGSPHGDNISASLLGGIVLVRSHNPLDVIRLHVPDKLIATVIHPKIEINTKSTRMILRKSVPLTRAVEQWGNVGGLIAGLYREDYGLIGRSLHDGIVEPVRSILIPGFDEMKEAAMQNGALGFSISGAGPSVFALSISEDTARLIGDSAGTILKKYDLDYTIHISSINKNGCRVVERDGEAV